MIRRKTIIHWLIVGVVCILAAAMLLILRHIAGNTASKPADTARAVLPEDYHHPVW